MHENFEDIYNKALKMLKQGHSKKEVLLEFGKDKERLAPLLDLSFTLLGLPKNVVPTPVMARKYAVVPVKGLALVWMHFRRFAFISLGVLTLVSSLSIVGYKTSKSAPGQTLFSVKKSAEKLQLILAADRNAKANLQIKFAQKRLNEAEAVFSNPSSDQEQKTAALQELASQTSTAVDEVSTAAQNDPAAANTQPLLASLDGMADKQQSLLAQIKTDDKIKPAAGDALQTLNKTTEKISAIKQTVAVADSERALTQLSPNQDSVAISGNINNITKDKITVEKTEFIINDQTTFKDASGTILSLKDLSSKDKVNIVGQKTQNTLTAKSVVLINIKDESQTASASGTSTVSTVLETSTPTSIKKVIGNTDSPSSTTPQVDPNAASGTFILEPPTPQFVK